MWLSAAQLAGLLNISERAIRKGLSSGRYITARYEESAQRGGNAGKAWKVSASDPALPPSIRQALNLEEPGDGRVKKIIEEASRMSIAPDQIHDEKTTLRLRVLARTQDRPMGVKKLDWYRRISTEEGVSLPTIYRWIADAERGKVVSDRAPVPVAIAVESGPIKVELKSRSFPPQALEYGLSLLMKNPMMDVKRAYGELASHADEQRWELGSLNSFYRAVRQLPEAVSILARSGRRGLEAVAKPAIRRDMDKVNVYDILIGDQHIFDYIVLDDDGQPIRPQMFAWADAKSRYFPGIWPVMGNYDQYAVGFALREACRYGLPRSLYNDWGKPEGSKYIEQLRRQLSGMAAFKEYEEIGDALPQTKAKPRNAQAKAIESYFYHTFENPLMQKGLPGYARRDIDDKRNEFLQGNLRKEIKGKKLFHAKAFFEIVLSVLDEWHKHTMTEDKTIPEDVFITGLPRLHRFDDQTLDFIFWPAEKRLVRSSIVRMKLPGFGVCEWYAPELSSLCRRGSKTAVEVRFNPYDASKVYVLDIHTHKMICIAERWSKVDPFDKSAVGTKIRRQNQIIHWWVDVARQLAKPEVKIHQLSLYESAATEITSIEKAREEIVVNTETVNRKIINLSKELEKEAALREATR